MLVARLDKPVHLDELRDAVDYIRAKHSKVNYAGKTILQSGGLFKKLEANLPLEVEERQSDDEAHVNAVMEQFLRSPMDDHQVRVKVLFAPTACDIVVAVSNGAGDIPASGMLVNDLLTRYADLVEDAANAPTSVDAAPVWDDISRVFPSGRRNGFLGSVAGSMKAYLRNMKKVHTNSPFRFPHDASAEANFLIMELNPDLTNKIDKIAVAHGVDTMSGLIASTLMRAKAYLRTSGTSLPEGTGDKPVYVDFRQIHDLRIAGFQPAFPNDTLSVGEVTSYHSISSGTLAQDRPLWDVARDIYTDLANFIRNDEIYDNYHFCYAEAVVRQRQMPSLPHPAFTFQDALNLSLDHSTISRLQISDFRLAETALPGTCKIIASRFKNKLQLSINYPVNVSTAEELENVLNNAIDDIRDSSDAPAVQQAAQTIKETNSDDSAAQ